jgi:UDP-GlcNAc:undecaprenyl-phosphate/decaprenyl-phosphate GlcNAc-1-phosphate transferase
VGIAGGYVQVGALAAVTTAVLTPVVRAAAVHTGYVTRPDERRVHTKETPSVGGVAMFAGFVVSFGVAWKMTRFAAVFKDSFEPIGIVAAATIITCVGLLDDLRKSRPKVSAPEGISAPAKVAGLVAAGAALAVFGVTMWYVRVPSFLGRQVLVLPADLVPLVTILWLLGMTNAINLIDGLDGLAAGIVAIASGTFFLYSRNLDNQHLTLGSGIGPLVAVIALGICVGFLPYNVHPARIFMGDSGALLLGGLLAVCTSVVGGRAEPAEGTAGAQGQTFFFFAPLFIPLVILGVPLFDMAFAIVRRATKRQGITGADKGHLHHRLMRLGHGHRRSVFILWLWTALLSGVVLYPAISKRGSGLVLFALFALGLGLYTILHPEVRRRNDTTESE